jgi:hypothetical protein
MYFSSGACPSPQIPFDLRDRYPAEKRAVFLRVAQVHRRSDTLSQTTVSEIDLRSVEMEKERDRERERGRERGERVCGRLFCTS